MAVRFLIADDSGPLRKALKTVIEGHPDWKVCGEAANGSEAVVLAKDLSPDIIVLDLTMPLMNGLEAARQIEEEKRRADEAARQTEEERKRVTALEATLERMQAQLRQLQAQAPAEEPPADD